MDVSKIIKIPFSHLHQLDSSFTSCFKPVLTSCPASCLLDFVFLGDNSHFEIFVSHAPMPLKQPCVISYRYACMRISDDRSIDDSVSQI